MPRINKSQYAIMGCLTLHPMSAYEMKSLMQKSTRYFWSEGEGQLYPTLKKLLSKGWVSFNEVAASKKGTKKIYTLTELGHSAFAAWFQSKTEPAVERNELLLKIFFGKSQPKTATIALLDAAIKDLKHHYATLQSISRYLSNRQESGINTSYYAMTLDYGLQITQAELNWAEQMLERLR